MGPIVILQSDFALHLASFLRSYAEGFEPSTAYELPVDTSTFDPKASLVATSHLVYTLTKAANSRPAVRKPVGNMAYRKETVSCFLGDSLLMLYLGACL